jgi:hypothetical protein
VIRLPSLSRSMTVTMLTSGSLCGSVAMDTSKSGLAVLCKSGVQSDLRSPLGPVTMVSMATTTDIVLHNGAQVIDARLDATQNHGVVLAKTNAVQPFVTWYASRALSSDGTRRFDCYWGHYFSSLADAMADFEQRCAANLPA